MGPEEFYKTGKHEIDSVLNYATFLGLRIHFGRALDFGCGVGRLTQALASHFDEVAGVDIAPSMLKVACKYNRMGERCRYFLNDAANLQLFQDRHFDFVYSNIVLQHMEPRYSKSYLQEFVRVLAPRGVLIFQLPGGMVQQNADQPAPARVCEPEYSGVRSITPLFKLLKSRISMMYRDPMMEMYTVPREEVIRELEDSGARVIDITENDFSGGDFVGLRYCVVKDRALIEEQLEESKKLNLRGGDFVHKLPVAQQHPTAGTCSLVDSHD